MSARLPLYTGSELQYWAEVGSIYEPTHSNITTVVAPDREHYVTLEVDDPVPGYLVRLRRRSGREPGDPETIARAIVDDHELAVRIAHEYAEHVEHYEQLDDVLEEI